MLGLGTLIGIMAIPSVAIAAVKGAIAGAVVAGAAHSVGKFAKETGVTDAVITALAEDIERKNSGESNDSNEQ